MSKKLRKNIDLKPKVKKALEERAAKYTPPLKLKYYIEFILEEFTNDKLIKLNKKL